MRSLHVCRFIVYVIRAALHLFQFYSNSLCFSPCLHPFAGFCSLCQRVLLMVMGLDAVRDWNCQHLDKNKGQLKEEFVFLSVCLFLCIWRTNCYLRGCVHATFPTLRVACSAGALATNIQLHQRNYVRQQSLYIPRTEQMEHAIHCKKIHTWVNETLVKASQLSGEGLGAKQGENNIWRGALLGMR